MWLALDADGVLQEGLHLNRLLPEVAVVVPIQELETPFLTASGFAAALEGWCASHGLAQYADLISSRHCAVRTDSGVIEEINAHRHRFDGIVLATNQVEERLSSMLRKYSSDFFDIVVASCTLGLAKPDPRYFSGLCDVAGVGPSSIVFVDDRVENVVAADQSGLVARHFRRMGGRLEMRRLLGSLAP